MRGSGLVAVVLLTGCGTAAYNAETPVAGTYWGINGTITNVESIKMVEWAPTKEMCQLLLAKERHDTEINAKAGKMTGTFSECHLVQVSPTGTWWGSALSGHDRYGFATSSREWCELARKLPSARFQCRPIGISE